MTRFCPRTTGSLHPQPLWTATCHQGLGAPGHQHPQGHQLHPMPFIPHMSTACSLIPLKPSPSCPMDTLKYTAPSFPPVFHNPAPHPPYPAPSCPISLKTLLHPAPVYPHILFHPALHPCRLPSIPPSSSALQIPPDPPSFPSFRMFQWHFPRYFCPEPPVFPEIATGRGPGAAGGARAADGEPRKWALRVSHSPERDHGSSGTSGETEARVRA